MVPPALSVEPSATTTWPPLMPVAVPCGSSERAAAGDCQRRAGAGGKAEHRITDVGTDSVGAAQRHRRDVGGTRYAGQRPVRGRIEVTAGGIVPQKLHVAPPAIQRSRFSNIALRCRVPCRHRCRRHRCQTRRRRALLRRPSPTNRPSPRPPPPPLPPAAPRTGMLSIASLLIEIVSETIRPPCCVPPHRPA